MSNITYLYHFAYLFSGVVGWCDHLRKRPVPGRPTDLNESRTRPTAVAVGAGGRCLDIFFLSFIFSFSLFLGDGPI